MPPDEFLIRKIEPGDRVTGFSLGEENLQPLKTFLQREAIEHHACNLTKTYVLVDSQHDSESDTNSPTVWGYISMLCSYVELSDENQPGDVENYYYQEFPAVKIARLAIDRRVQKGGLGKALIRLAIATIDEFIMPNIGCRFIVVDSKSAAVSWYSEQGFKIMATEEPQKSDATIMYLDLMNLDEQNGEQN